MEQLQQQLSQHVLIETHPPQVLKWRDGSKAPFKMARGAAVVDGNVAYFMDLSGEACSYNTTSKKWSKLPKYSYQCATLAVINGQLTAIGGCENWSKGHTYTDKLLSLNRIWSAIFPPMPTKQCLTTAATSKEHLIEVGGASGPRYTDNISTVEVMNTKTLVWSIASGQPPSPLLPSISSHLWRLSLHAGRSG